ncbi:MAG: glycosyltransferase [Thermodesulfobacteriota bacterium]
MKSLKRVLWISDYFPTPHNQARGVWALETLIAIQKQGVEVIALSPTPWIPRWLAFASNLREWSGFPHEFKIRDLSIFYPKCLYYPHRFTRYLYGFIPPFDRLSIYHWCKKTISRLIDCHPFQAIHSDFIFPSGFIGLEIKKRYGIPLVVHERGVHRLTLAISNALRRKLYAQVLKESDIVIAPSYKWANLVKKIVPNEREINVIREGVDIKTADSFVQQKPKMYEGKKIILSVGQLIERKGHEYLVRAINEIKNEFPDIKCIIIGSGICLRSLEDLINKLGLNNIVELYGQRPHDEVLKTMSWCDVFVLPSWDEPFGAVYSEAMAFAKPIIACSGEGISEVVQDGGQGLLVKRQNAESLAEALKKVSRDENLASSLGREGRMLVEKELNWNHIASQLIDLYKQIII